MDILKVNLSIAAPSWEKLNVKTENNKVPIERMYHTTTLIND